MKIPNRTGKYKIQNLLLITFLFVIISPSLLYGQASCGTPGSLTPGSTCSTTAGNLKNATNTGAPSVAPCGTGATTTNTYGVWYRFTANSTKVTVTVSGLGSGLSSTNTYVQVLSGSCATLVSLACSNVSSPLIVNGLVLTNSYYVRVYVIGSSPSTIPNNQWNFNICIQAPASNDEPNTATNLTSSATCSNTSTSLNLATPTVGLPSGCESTGSHYDVWYKFTATAAIQLVTISSLGTAITNPEMQLYSGTPGALTSLACGTTSVASAGLNVGTVYFVRVSNVGSQPYGSGSNFTICVTTPTPSTVQCSKSYINVSKGVVGGTIDPGDTLEMRATFVIKSQTADSLAFFDTVYNGGGIKYVPGSLSLRTNEDKIYKSFTDAQDADAGYADFTGTDTTIRINFGTGATNTARGKLSNTSKPSVYNGTCIIMATYRVVVYAPYNTKINFRSGSMTFRDAATSLMNTGQFLPDSFIVYNSPGLCPNAVSPNNAIGAESNGTFGTPSGPSPLLRNRGVSAYTTYTYAPFNSTSGPQDYFYGIANNTSQSFTTTTTWSKPDPTSPAHRVFGLWDIIGDHTGASNSSKGNPPCDTTLPVSATNPCGYMLIINSAYKTDTAFQYTATNLCPNTNYEISAWFRNICYKCGCDSNGVGATGAGYIPLALNDSSGVQPNLAFDVNGTDYYTTGNIPYYGVTQAGSDSTNKWVKRGFTYTTGPSQSSFTLTIRNNAPGGGGNDWAIDDIGINTCLPNMKYSPSLSPNVCMNNTITINDTIQSYFNSYQNYQWQRSTDNGSTWTNITAATGTASPAWNGSAYQYITSYTVPPSNTNSSDSGNQYRVIVATTTSNLSNPSCQVTDGVSIIKLTVTNCGIPLSSQLLTFNGRLKNNYSNLFWTVSNESGIVNYQIEKSLDGINFNPIKTIKAYNNNSTSNYYTFLDSVPVTKEVWFRIGFVNNRNENQYSNIIKLSNTLNDFNVTNVINPFKENLSFNITVTKDAKVEASISTINGNILKKQTYTAFTGTNNFSILNLESLTPGVYLLQIQYDNQTINRKIIKN